VQQKLFFSFSSSFSHESKRTLRRLTTFFVQQEDTAEWDRLSLGFPESYMKDF
jgi:hypothetical protein